MVSRAAAAKYVLEHQHKKSIDDDIGSLKILDKYIGHLSLESVHMGTLQPYILARQNDRVKNRTINSGLQIARHILNLAAGEWMDESGMT